MPLTEFYNTTNLTQAENIPDLLVVANNATGQIFVGGFLIAFFIIILMTLMTRFRFDESIFASSFAGFFISIFLRQAQLINFTFVIGFLIIMALSGLLMYMKK